MPLISTCTINRLTLGELVEPRVEIRRLSVLSDLTSPVRMFLNLGAAKVISQHQFSMTLVALRASTLAR